MWQGGSPSCPATNRVSRGTSTTSLTDGNADNLVFYGDAEAEAERGGPERSIERKRRQPRLEFDKGLFHDLHVEDRQFSHSGVHLLWWKLTVWDRVFDGVGEFLTALVRLLCLYARRNKLRRKLQGLS